jgi:hypothetical protein
MAKRATLTGEALSSLGTEKLTKLILDEVGRNAPFKKLVMAALAATKGPDAIAAIVDRRLAGLERARGYVEWDKRKDLAADLRAILVIIADELGDADPASALDRLVRFLCCAERVFERVDDSSGHIQTVFHDAAGAASKLAAKMTDDERLPFLERLVPRLLDDEYGLLESVVQSILLVLPPASLSGADRLLQAMVKKDGPQKQDDLHDWQDFGRRERLIRARQAIADRRGDVDGFIMLEQARSERVQDDLAIAERLLAAGRLPEALERVRKPRRRSLRVMHMADIADASSGSDVSDRSRVDLEVRILSALGRRDEAQDLRWRTFEATLEPDVLRDYVDHLPDFEDSDALDRAFAHAATHRHHYRALEFFLTWPHLEFAAKLVTDHLSTWSGQHYEMLAPAAEALEHEHPAAAAALYRILIDDILVRARLSAYGHAARYLDKLAEIDCPAVSALLGSNEAYRGALDQTHGRKASFWSIVDGQKQKRRGSSFE